MAGYAQYHFQLQTEINEARALGADKINQAKAVFVPTKMQYVRGSAGPKLEADVNCSVCTAAAVARKRTGVAWNTDSVNQQLGEKSAYAFTEWRRKTAGGLQTQMPAGATNSEKNLQDQIDGLAEWCSRTLGFRRRKIIGTALAPVSSSFALAWMRAQDDGTLFAVYVYVPLFTAYDPLAHWIYAEKDNGNLKFFDYQADKAEIKGSAPAESSEPMKPGGAPIPGKYQMIVVAFCPDVGKPLTGGRL
jgi:hypothetical protein